MGSTGKRVLLLFLAGVSFALVWLSSASGAAISVRGSTSADNGVGATTLDLPAPAGIVEGDLLLAQLTIRTTGVAATITAPAGWSAVVNTASGSGAAQIRQVVYRTRATAAEPASYTWTFSAARVASGGIVAYLGVDTSANPIANSAARAGTCAAGPCSIQMPASGTFNAVSASNWVAGLWGIGSASTWTPPVALAERYGQAATGEVASEHASAEAGVVTVPPQTAQASGSGRWIAQLLALRLDLTAPSAALGAVGTPLSGIVPLTASASDAGSGVESVVFQVSPAGADTWSAISVDAAAPYAANLDTTALGDGLYDIRAVSLDWAGNRTSSAFSSSHLVDNTSPAVTLEDPGTTLAGTITLDATASDAAGSGVTSVSFERSPAGADTWTTIAIDTTTPYSASLDTTTVADAGYELADGTYDLRALATDAAGNTAAAVAPGRIVDNAVSTGSIDAAGLYLRGTVALEGNAQDGGSGIASVAFELAPAGASAWVTFATDLAGPYEATLDTTGYPDGAYELRLVVTDGAGNTTPTEAVGRTIDNTPPSCTVGGLSGSDASVVISGSDAGSGVALIENSVDGGPFLPGAEAVLSGPGAHAVSCRATDGAGNVGPVATASVVVEAAEPQPDPFPSEGGASATPEAEAGGTDVVPGLASEPFAMRIVRLRVKPRKARIEIRLELSHHARVDISLTSPDGALIQRWRRVRSAGLARVRLRLSKVAARGGCFVLGLVVVGEGGTASEQVELNVRGARRAPSGCGT